MKLKSITLVLENCDSITIDGKYIGDFCVDDIRTSIRRVACNAVNKMAVVHKFFIEIHKDADCEYQEFGQSGESFTRMKFRRLQDNDITSIEFDLFEDYLNEGEEPNIEHYDYYLHWTGDSEYVNDSSKVYISDLGHLYIVVSETEELKDYVDLNEINDEKIMDFKFKMYDVGDENQHDYSDNL